MTIKDITGQKFGKLTAVQFDHMSKGHAYWKCICDCGNHKIARGSHLLFGNVSSCGCKKANFVHGKTKTRLYIIRRNMIDRCTNESNSQYERYGGRGISVCDEWKKSFVPFHDWAMANGYSDDLTIDRIDNNGNYEPSNCRWATKKEQANNTRKNHNLTHNGKTQSISEWARELNISQSVLSARINKYGWSVEKALGKRGN